MWLVCVLVRHWEHGVTVQVVACLSVNGEERGALHLCWCICFACYCGRVVLGLQEHGVQVVACLSVNGEERCSVSVYRCQQRVFAPVLVYFHL
jgi:hypothetical protein